MALLLGIDLGTSYFKVGLFDSAGTLQGLGRVAVEKDSPAPGRSELPVPRFWSLLRRGLAEALAQAGAGAADIAAVSYSSQANSFVLLDPADAPLTPIVLWTDARAEPLHPELEEFSRREDFATTVGFAPWSGGFAVAKWRWWQENERATWAKARRLLTIADYFTFALTGQCIGDASTAAFLGLYDLAQRQWWPAALTACRIQTARLSSPVVPGAFIGRTGPQGAELLGLRSGVPFAVGGLDHHVAALGSGLGKLADVSISTGTVLAAMTLVPAPSPRTGCFHGPDFDGVRFFRLAFDPAGAGQLEDYQRRFAPGLTLEELLALAAAAPACGEAVALSGAKGHGVAFRYVLEKIAATHRRLIGQVTAGTEVSRIVATGGGARSALWLQIKADMFGVPIMTPTSPERACLGAAMLASVAAGWQRDAAQAMMAMMSPGRVFEPDAARVARYRAWAP